MYNRLQNKTCYAVVPQTQSTLGRRSCFSMQRLRIYEMMNPRVCNKSQDGQCSLMLLACFQYAFPRNARNPPRRKWKALSNLDSGPYSSAPSVKCLFPRSKRLLFKNASKKYRKHKFRTNISVKPRTLFMVCKA